MTESKIYYISYIFIIDPDFIPLTMPALSPTMEKGNIANWKLNVGDQVKASDVVAEVETDKATVRR